MRNKIDLYSRISVAIVLAFLTSQLLVQEVFLAQSPQVRPDLADRVVETSLALVNIDNYANLFQGRQKENLSSRLASNETEALEQLERVQYKPTLVEGVYAKETENAAIYRINDREIDWIEVDYQTNDGSIQKIQIPRGTQPPPPGLF